VPLLIAAIWLRSVISTRHEHSFRELLIGARARCAQRIESKGAQDILANRSVFTAGHVRPSAPKQSICTTINSPPPNCAALARGGVPGPREFEKY
jgi:hypothetical protein